MSASSSLDQYFEIYSLKYSISGVCWRNDFRNIQYNYSKLDFRTLKTIFQLNPDVNPFQRTFVRDIRRFDEMERKLRFLESQIAKDNIIVGGKVDDGDYKVMGQAELNQLEV